MTLKEALEKTSELVLARRNGKGAGQELRLAYDVETWDVDVARLGQLCSCALGALGSLNSSQIDNRKKLYFESFISGNKQTSASSSLCLKSNDTTLMVKIERAREAL